MGARVRASLRARIVDDRGRMRALIADCTVAMLLLSLGCQPAPPEVTDGSGAATSDTSPASTGAGSTSSAGDGTTAAGSASASGSSGSGSASSSSGATDPSSDTGASDSTTGDPNDEPLGPFGPPVAVAELNSLASEDDPSLTADMLEIYFASTRTLSEDVWVSTRISVDDPWDAPVPVDAVNSGWQETFPEVSPDGLVLLLASDRAFIGDLDVYYAQRASRGDEWSTPVPLTGAATPGANDWGATPILDMSRVLLCRDMPRVLGGADIWEATADFDAWVVDPAVHVPELSTATAECSATASQSGREVFFETTRADGPVFGWNLWTATREDPAGPWDAPVSVAELNSDADDIDPWLSPDRRTLWFASNRAVGHNELYVATRR